jgi:hypothetical protein
LPATNRSKAAISVVARRQCATGPQPEFAFFLIRFTCLGFHACGFVPFARWIPYYLYKGRPRVSRR